MYMYTAHMQEIIGVVINIYFKKKGNNDSTSKQCNCYRTKLLRQNVLFLIYLCVVYMCALIGFSCMMMIVDIQFAISFSLALCVQLVPMHMQTQFLVIIIIIFLILVMSKGYNTSSRFLIILYMCYMFLSPSLPLSLFSKHVMKQVSRQ